MSKSFGRLPPAGEPNAEDIERRIAGEPDLRPIDGGYHVKTTADGRYCIDIYRMMYNWRLTISPVDHEGDHQRCHQHGWCYFGHGDNSLGKPRDMQTAFLSAYLAARDWDGVGEPVGYDKRAY